MLTGATNPHIFAANLATLVQVGEPVRKDLRVEQIALELGGTEGGGKSVAAHCNKMLQISSFGGKLLEPRGVWVVGQER